MMTVERVNEYTSRFCVFAWWAGLAYFGWLSSIAIHVPWWALLILVLPGTFFASVVVGGAMALAAGLLTKALTGRFQGSPHAFAWAAFIAPVLAFMTSRWGLLAFSGL